MQPGEQSENQPNPRAQRGMSGLFGDVSRGLRELVREELRRARDEMSDKAVDVGRDVGTVGVGGLMVYAGYLLILGGVVEGLKKLGMPRWLGGILVGTLAASGGTALILKGLDNLKLKEPVVEEAKEQLRETVVDVQSDAR